MEFAIELLGFCCVASGAALIYPPLGLIVMGLALILVAQGVRR